MGPTPKNLLEQVGDMMGLTGKTVLGATHPHPEGCFLDCPACERLRRAGVEIAVRDGID